MRHRVHVAALFVLALLLALPTPPSGRRAAAADREDRAAPARAHGQARIDNYYWLKERTNPEVVAYLEAENAWAAQAMKHTEALQETLFNEMVGRLKQDDSSVPYLDEGYWYYTRFVEGGNYPLYCRRRGSSRRARRSCSTPTRSPAARATSRRPESSPHRAATSWPSPPTPSGGGSTRSASKDLATGALLPDTIKDVTGNLAWANDNRTLFYTRQDPATLRSHRVYRHELGADPANDVLVYEETDETYSALLAKTKSKRFVTIVSGQTLATGGPLPRRGTPREAFRVFLRAEPRPRVLGRPPSGDRFYIRTNAGAKNFKLVANAGRPRPPARTGATSLSAPRRHLRRGFRPVPRLPGRRGAPRRLTQLRVVRSAAAPSTRSTSASPPTARGSASTARATPAVLRYTYSSLTTRTRFTTTTWRRVRKN